MLECGQSLLAIGSVQDINKMGQCEAESFLQDVAHHDGIIDKEDSCSYAGIGHESIIDGL